METAAPEKISHPKEKEENRWKNTFYGGPGPLSPSSLSTSLLVSSPPHSSLRAKGTILPTRVSRKKVSTAGAACMSSNINLTAGARGLSHSHNLAILFPLTRAWPAHAGHLATRCNLDWRSPVSHHQHLSESI